MGERRVEVRGVFVVGAECQQSRRPQQQRFDGVGRQPFAQDGLVGYQPGQPQVGPEVEPVAQGAEIEPVERFVPVLARRGVEFADHAHLAPEPVEDQRRADFVARERLQPRQITAAGIFAGARLQPFQGFRNAWRHPTAC